MSDMCRANMKHENAVKLIWAYLGALGTSHIWEPLGHQTIEHNHLMISFIFSSDLTLFSQIKNKSHETVISLTNINHGFVTMCKIFLPVKICDQAETFHPSEFIFFPLHRDVSYQPTLMSGQTKVFFVSESYKGFR